MLVSAIVMRIITFAMIGDIKEIRGINVHFGFDALSPDF